MKKKTHLFLISGVVLSMLLAGCGLQDNKIVVHFDWNFKTEEVIPNSKKVTPGEPYGELPVPSFTRTGYDFSGWNTRDDGRGDMITAETTVDKNKDHTLYAYWAGRQYTVSYDLNGGNINGVTSLAPRTVTYGNMYGAMVIPENPEKNLATFLGWFLDKNGKGTPITYSTKVETAEDHTLYAVFKEMRTEYNFENDAELEDFYDVNGNLTMNITDEGLELSNTSDDPRAYLNLNNPMKAGSYLDLEVEFWGNVDKDAGVRACFFAYGLDNNQNIISSGDLMDPELSEVTRQQVRWWYWGQGSNNLTDGAGDVSSWNHGHLTYSMNILEDCSGISMMMEFGRKRIGDEYDPDKTLWQENQWVIRSIKLHHANYDYLKDEYKFDDALDINSFINAKDLNMEIDTDSTLKLTKGNAGEERSYLELETQYLPKGSKVDVEVAFYGDLTTSNRVGIFSYGNYPDGTLLNYRKPDNTDVTNADPIYVRDWFWGGYSTTNENWANIKLVDGEKVTFTNYVFEDCYGITFMLEFGGIADGYFKISHVKITRSNDIINTYNFENENQLNDFAFFKNCNANIEEDDVGNYLKVEQLEEGHAFLTVKTLLKKDATVHIYLEYQTENAQYSSGNQFTFLPYKATYGGAKTGNNLAVIGNANWDGGWTGENYRMSTQIDDDCYGLTFEFVFNSDANAYFRIRSIEIR